MKRVLKSMAGILLSALILVSMETTVLAAGISYSDLPGDAKTLYDGFKDSPGYSLEELQGILEKYLFGDGVWPEEYSGIEGISKEDARILYDFMNGTDNTEASAKEHTKTATEKIQEKAVKEIDKALQTDSHIAVFDGRNYNINTLSRDLMNEINKKGVSMVFKYTYNGYYYEVTIPAGNAPVDPNVPWCGPMYLYSLFHDTAVVTPIE